MGVGRSTDLSIYISICLPTLSRRGVVGYFATSGAPSEWRGGFVFFGWVVGAMETYRRRSSYGGVSSSCVVAVALAAALWVGMVTQCVVADNEGVSFGAAVANSKYFRHMTFPNHRVEGVVTTERRTERVESPVSSVHLCLFCCCGDRCVCLYDNIVREHAVVLFVVLWVPCLVAFLLPLLFGVACGLIRFLFLA